MKQFFNRKRLVTTRLVGGLAAMIAVVSSDGFGQNVENLASEATKDLQSAFAELSKVRQEAERTACRSRDR